jgi:replicative DNA helicase
MASSPQKLKKPSTAPPIDIGKLPPHSEEAEQALLGSILINPDSLILVEFLTPEDFYIIKHAWMFEAARAIDGRSEQIDYVTMIQELRQMGKLDESGGPAYITHVINHTPSSIYAETYGRIIQRAAIRRRMLLSASRTAQLAHDETVDAYEAVNQAHLALDAATESAERPIKVLSQAVSDYFDTIINGDDQPTLQTGFKDLDELLGGLKPDDLMIVAGRPGMGKTSWLLSMILQVTRRIKRDNTGQYVLHASLEMSESQVVQRFYSMVAGIPVTVQRARTLNEQQIADFVNATEELSELPLIIEDRPALTIRQLKSSCLRAKRRFGPLALVVVDYAQLMSIEPEVIRELHLNNSESMFAYLSRQLKELARTLKVPVLVACQLNREVERRKDKRPQMADLRGSGSWEQDADIIAFLYRDEVYNENTERPNEAEVNIAKYRHGSPGTVSLYFDKGRTFFGDLSRTTIPLNDLAWQSWPGQSQVVDPIDLSEF